MASDLSSGCTETIDIFDEKEEGEISLEDVSSSEEGGIGHLTCGYVVRSRRSCTNCRLTGECASWCTTNSKAYCSKSQNRRGKVYLNLCIAYLRYISDLYIKIIYDIIFFHADINFILC